MIDTLFTFTPGHWVSNQFKNVCFLCSLCLGATPAVGGEFVVVVGKQAPLVQLRRDDVADLFLDRRPVHDLKPLDLEDDHLRDDFYREVAGMSPHSVRAYWVRRVFTGRGRPPDRISVDEVRDVLSQQAPFVTYVPTNQANADYRVLLVVGSGDEP